ncbi:uncharacterized protein CC84DRAFT_1137773 [Paraphaeosphaeria sporulosa]|uniref:DUF4396 domain-containing protein n=1 Tax=Paraphaeosphaeria sporulosa TaxID=1460663 RepID=A0A177CSB0_9PLEO|nr:uncharacterized protein CC84DRAFT_1137773 [Paraphaeosphaeria sporulosa]OAG09822.1 hypothetical protein CC84DRAFT_1137773 [Paraphaeosphaeria sporulosa]
MSRRPAMRLLSTRATVLLSQSAPLLRTCTRPHLAVGSRAPWGHPQGPLTLQRSLKCSKDRIPTPSCSSQTTISASMTTSQFWASTATWKRAAVNTLRCLVGCTAGDFSAMWYLQLSHPTLGMGTIMAISMASGITSSMLLETTLLRYGYDRLPWMAAARTAAGMSMISMITMELAENVVDYYLTGGVVQLDSAAFWGAALLSVSAGFIAPLPYNYVRLRKYGRACH